MRYSGQRQEYAERFKQDEDREHRNSTEVDRKLLELDGLNRIVRHDGAAVQLGPTEFRIVALLARTPLLHEALYERVYVDRADGGPGNDSFHATISLLRRKLRSLGLRITSARWDLPYRLEE